MKSNNYITRLGNWQQLQADCRMLREIVFIQEQNVPPELEWDGLDQTGIHAIAYDKAGHAIATGRVLPDGHIGRMAVLAHWRNKGVGSTILQLLVKYALEQLGCKPWLDAQTHAVDFYLRHGFEVRGEIFTDAGILHRHMYWVNNSNL